MNEIGRDLATVDPEDAPSTPQYEGGPTSRQIMLLTAAFWVVEVMLAELRSVVDHSVKIELYTVLRTLSAALGILECYLIHRVARSMSRTRLRVRGTLVLLLAALAGVINLKGIDLLQNLSAYPVSDYGLGWRIYNATYWAMLFVVWAAIYLALDYSRTALTHERRARLLEQLAYDAQLNALRFQINPHFLFNTLNSVSALVLEGRNSDAETMIERLSEFFRTILLANPCSEVTLSEETALQEVYLEIERVRFPDLSFHVAVDPGAARLRVPSLILQPLVENAVKFAMVDKRIKANVGISAGAPADGIVQIEVWDDGGGRAAQAGMTKGTGTGLTNVRERLRIRYGDQASVELMERYPRGMTVVVKIPMG